MAAGLEVEVDHEGRSNLDYRTNHCGFLVVVASSVVVVEEAAALESSGLVDDDKSVNTRLDLLSFHTSSLYILMQICQFVCVCN